MPKVRDLVSDAYRLTETIEVNEELDLANMHFGIRRLEGIANDWSTAEILVPGDQRLEFQIKTDNNHYTIGEAEDNDINIEPPTRILKLYHVRNEEMYEIQERGLNRGDGDYDYYTGNFRSGGVSSSGTFFYRNNHPIATLIIDNSLETTGGNYQLIYEGYLLPRNLTPETSLDILPRHYHEALLYELATMLSAKMNAAPYVTSVIRRRAAELRKNLHRLNIRPKGVIENVLSSRIHRSGRKYHYTGRW